MEATPDSEYLVGNVTFNTGTQFIEVETTNQNAYSLETFYVKAWTVNNTEAFQMMEIHIRVNCNLKTVDLTPASAGAITISHEPTSLLNIKNSTTPFNDLLFAQYFQSSLESLCPMGKYKLFNADQVIAFDNGSYSPPRV